MLDINDSVHNFTPKNLIDVFSYVWALYVFL